MTAPISDLTLERLALGELDDREASALLAELEQRGEMHRFEALIADNDEFAERFPPAMVAAQVMEKARRNERADAPAPRGRRFGPVVFAGIAAVIVGWLVWPEPPPAAPKGTEPAGPESPTVPLPGPDVSQFGVTVVDPSGEFALPDNLYMRVGEEMSFRTSGSKRIEVADVSLLKTTNDDGVITLHAKKAGRSVFRVVGKPAKPGAREPILSAFVAIGDPIAYDRLSELATSQPEITSCTAQAPGFRGILRLGVVAQYKPSLASIDLLRGTPPPADQLQAFKACVGDIVSHWNLEPEQWQSGTLRINLATGSVCPEDQDC